VRETFARHAASLAGADRRWLRAMTGGVLWLLLAAVSPWAFALSIDWWPRTDQGAWFTADRQKLLIAIAPAVFALAGCWRLGTARRDPPVAGDAGDQALTRWGLRVLAVGWFVPPLFLAGPFYDGRSEWLRYNSRNERESVVLLVNLAFAALPTAVLAFRRLRAAVGRARARFLPAACGAIGWQLPLVFLLVTDASHRWSERMPDAQRYVVQTPMPAVGPVWLEVDGAEDFREFAWRDVLETRGMITIYAAAIVLAVPLLLIGVLIALVVARRKGPDLAAYCRERLPEVERAEDRALAGL
jgi:hypothetical protein